MIVSKDCFNRGCCAHDDRVDGPGVGVDVFQKAASNDQLLALWKASEGHALRFARLVESYHGIGEIIEESADVQPVQTV